jgi:serine/threonine-protein kinase
VELDERNARAYAGLADVIALLPEHSPETVTGSIRTSSGLISRALILDPDLAEAHASLGTVLARDYRFPEAQAEFELAISLNPSYPSAHHWYAVLLATEGRADEAGRELTLAVEADPLSSVILAMQVVWLLATGRLDEARAKLPKLAEVEKDGPEYQWARGWYCLVASDFAGARRAFDRFAEVAPDDPNLPELYGTYYALTGQRDKAEEALRRLMALPDTVSYRDHRIAALFAVLGDSDRCFAWLERAFDNRSIDFWTWRTLPWLGRISADPRFHSLLRRAHLE